MALIFNDYRDFKPGELVELNPAHIHKYEKTAVSSLGIVTGFTNLGWIEITWSNGFNGTHPYYKLLKAEKFPATCSA